MPKISNFFNNKRLKIPKNKKKKFFGNVYVLLREEGEKNPGLVSFSRAAQALDLFDESEYKALSPILRKVRVQKTLEYLRSIPEIPRNAFKDEQGKDIPDLNINDLNKVVFAAHSTIGKEPSPFANKTLARMPTAVMVHWIYVLDQAGNSAPERERAIINRLISKNKLLWLSHKLSISDVKNTLKQNSQLLRDNNLLSLADIAYASNGSICLYNQLPIVDNFRFYKTQLNDNIYGAAFESALIGELVKNPPESLLSAMTSLGHALELMLQDMLSSDVKNFIIPKLYAKVCSNKRPWFSKMPRIQDFIQLSSQVVIDEIAQRILKTKGEPLLEYEKAAEAILERFPDSSIQKFRDGPSQEYSAVIEEVNLRRYHIICEILRGPVRDGFHAILVPYLIQKLYVVRYSFSDLLIDKSHYEWMKETQRLYNEIDPIKTQSFQKDKTIQLRRANKFTTDYIASDLPVPGITHSFQPPAVEPLDSGPIDRPATETIANLDRSSMPVSLEDALRHGIPFATGISGTTNLYLGTLSHLISDLGYDIDVPVAFLGLLMFLVYDGGHSIHEAIWTLNHRESKGNKKYVSIGFNIEKSNKKSLKKINGHVSDYLNLRNSYKKNSDILFSFDSAIDCAWKTLLFYFGKYSIYKEGISESTSHHVFTDDELIKNFVDKANRYREDISKKEISEDFLKLVSDLVENSNKVISKTEALYIIKYNFKEIRKINNSNNKFIIRFIDELIICLDYYFFIKNQISFHKDSFFIKENNIWKFLTDTENQKKHNAFSLEEGVHYIPVMLKDYQAMINSIDKPISVNFIRQIFGLVVEKTGIFNLFRNFQDVDISDSFKIYDDQKKSYNLFILRNNEKHSLKDQDKSRIFLTEACFLELVKQCQGVKNIFSIEDSQYFDDGSLKIGEDGKIGTLFIPKRKSHDIDLYIKDLIDKFYLEISRLHESSDKYIPIIRFCKKLSSANILLEYNEQVIFILIFNKLLAQNGLPLVIWDDISKIKGFSVNEILSNVKKGQENFSNIFDSSEAYSIYPTSEYESSIPASANRNINFFPENDCEIQDQVHEKYLENLYAIKTENKDEFKEGYNLKKEQEITIPGFQEGMNLFEMETLSLSDSLNLREFGSLAKKISDTLLNLNPEDVENFLWVSFFAFKDLQGYTYRRSLSQILMVSLFAPHSSGFCSGLTWVVATALAVRGKEDFEVFAEKVERSMLSPENDSSRLLKEALLNLHVDANAHFRSRADEAKNLYLSLSDIYLELSTLENTKFYEINTEDHTMLVGVVLDSLSAKTHNKRRFFFYDPNFGLVEYDQGENFLQALKRFFSDRERLLTYRPFGVDEKPLSLSNDELFLDSDTLRFEFQYIDVEKYRKSVVFKALGSYLTLEDLLSQDDLSQKFKFYDELSLFEREQNILKEDNDFKASNRDLDLSHIARNALISLKNIKNFHSMPDDKIPILSKIEKNRDEYKIPFIDRFDRDREIKWVETTDSTLFKTKTYIDTQIEKVNNSHKISENFELEKKSHVTSEIHIDGLNSGFAVQQLIAWIQKGNRDEQISPNIAENLATALSVHSYVSLAQIAQGTVYDIESLIAIVQTLLKQNSLISSSPISAFAKSLSCFGQALGSGLMIGSAALDIYELVHAENEIQKSVFGTQLAIDTIGSALSLAGMGAGIAGYSTVAGVIGPLGVITGGLGVGAAGLAEAYGELLEDTKSIASYFDEVDKAYQEGYSYTEKNKQILFKAGAIIKEINLCHNDRHIIYDSQYLYAFDYRLSYLDSGSDNGSRRDAIAVRCLLGRSESLNISKEHLASAEALVLPSTRKTYIHSYEQQIIGLRSTKGEEYACLKTMEANSGGRFRFEYFFFPYERIIREISHEMVPTDICIRLDKKRRTLIIPELPKELKGRPLYSRHQLSQNVTYTILGLGETYSIVLNKGAEVSVSSGDSRISSTWIIDTRALGDDAVTFNDKTMIIDGVLIRCSSWSNDIFHVLKHDLTLEKIDFSESSPKLLVSHLNAREWNKSHKETIETHVKELGAHHGLTGRYTAISQFIYNDIPVGNSYYDNEIQRILFSLYRPFSLETLKEIDITIRNSWDSVLRPVERQVNVTTSQGSLACDCYLLTQEKKTLRISALNILNNLLKAYPDIVPEGFSQTLNNIALWAEKDNQVIEDSVKREDLRTSKKRIYEKVIGDPVRISYQNLHNHPKVNLAITTDLLLNELSALRSAIQPVITAVQLCNEGELVGVIGDKAYFYHRGKNVLWMSDAVTYKVEKQFLCLIKMESVRFWQDDRALYAAYKAHIQDTPDKGEFICRIDENSMTVIGLHAEDATTEDSLIEWLSHSIFCYFKGAYSYSTINADAQFPRDIPTIRMDVLPLVSISGKDKTGVDQQYWVQLPTRVIQFNCPQSIKRPVDLRCIFQTKLSDKKPVLYFYSLEEKKLFRQEGYGRVGVDDNTSKTADARLIDISDLKDAFVADGQLYALTEEGILYAIDGFGKTNFYALTERWLVTHKETWQKDLSVLSASYPILRIIGIKNANSQFFSVWFHRGQLIFSSLISVSIQLISPMAFNETGVYLFDPKGQKLYKQPLMSEAYITGFLNEGFPLKTSTQIPNPIDLSPNFLVQSVQAVMGNIFITTVEGVILKLNPLEQPRFVGLNEKWLSAHDSQWKESLGELLKKWDHEDHIFLHGKPEPTWYYVPMCKLVKATGLSYADKPIFLGVDSHQEIFYISCEDKGLYSYVSDGTDFSVGQRVSTNRIQRHGNAVTVQGNGSKKLYALDLLGCDTLFLSGGSKMQEYCITSHLRKNVKNIIIDNYDPDEDFDLIKIECQDCRDILISRNGPDLFMKDKDGMIGFKNVFVSQGEMYQHAQLMIWDGNGTFYENLSKIVNYLTLSKDETIHFTVLRELETYREGEEVPEISEI
jgi:hypothetical protein